MCAFGQSEFHHALQLSARVQLAYDIASADELAVYIDLGDGRPVAVSLDSVAHFLVRQHVNRAIGHAQLLENLDRRRREAALRKTTIAFHENDDSVAIDRTTDSLDCISHLRITSGSDTD